MARSCLKELPHHRLTDLAEYFHISTEGAHRALNDCMMNQKCYEKMGILMKETGTLLSDTDVCPRCGGQLIKRNGRFGPFYGCGNFPKCRYTRNWVVIFVKMCLNKIDVQRRVLTAWRVMRGVACRISGSWRRRKGGFGISFKASAKLIIFSEFACFFRWYVIT